MNPLLNNFRIGLVFGAILCGASLAPAPIASAKPLGLPTNPGLPSTLADLIEHVSPAVVNIRVETSDGTTTKLGQGSGFIVTPDGKLITNFHVIESGTKYTVEFSTGERHLAKIVGTDKETDMAVLQIQSKKKFKYVEFHRGKPVRIGDWALAIGNPFGIGQSSSVGIVSAIGRERVESGSFIDYIQTDATVNRGNSGGPLFDLKGKVIGVNSAIFSPTGASVGIAFAIPHFMAEEIAAELIRNGKITRGFLGVTLRDAEKDSAGTVIARGASVETVGAGSPAAAAGLQPEDIILRINGKPVSTAVQATRAIARMRVGDTARFDIERKDKRIDNLRTKIAARPHKEEDRKIATGSARTSTVRPIRNNDLPPTGGRGAANTGLSLADLSSTFRDTIGMRPDQVGVYVDQVREGSSAAQRGIVSGMVILEANGQKVASVQMFRSIVRKARQANQNSLVLLVRSARGSENFTSISLS